MQPLNVSCFIQPSQKQVRTVALIIFTSHWRKTTQQDCILQPNFTIWHQRLTKENIISGFSSTGNFPVDYSKYKVCRLDKVKLQIYNEWKAKGAPVDEHEEPMLMTPL